MRLDEHQKRQKFHDYIMFERRQGEPSRIQLTYERALQAFPFEGSTVLSGGFQVQNLLCSNSQFPSGMTTSIIWSEICP